MRAVTGVHYGETAKGWPAKTAPKKRLPRCFDARHYARRQRMSSAAMNPPVAPPPPGAAPDSESLKPVQRPARSAFRLLREVLEHGGPGYLQFAITNICNADCDFCGFARSKFDSKARRSVTLQEAHDVIDLSVRNHIGYLLFVGGEPMVHKELRAMTRYAAERGIHPMICTNGGLWNEDNMKGLASDEIGR